MSDWERMKDLFDELGIRYTVIPGEFSFAVKVKAKIRPLEEIEFHFFVDGKLENQRV